MSLPVDSGLTQQQRNNPRLSGDFVYDTQGFELALLQQTQVQANSAGWSQFLPSEPYQQQALLDYVNALLAPLGDPEQYCLNTIGEITNHRLLELINLIDCQHHTELTRILTDAQLPAQLPPHVQLVLVAIKKLLALQTLFSQLPTQYRDYYYQQHLSYRPSSALPVTVYVQATLQADAEPFLLPRGALFTAEAEPDPGIEESSDNSSEQDSTPDRQFVLKHDTMVSHSQLNAIRAILAFYEEPASREATDETGLRGCTTLYEVSEQEDTNFPTINVMPWLAPAHSDVSHMQGAYVQSELLWLAEGERVITLTIPADLAQQMVEASDELTLFITTEAGWQDITANSQIAMQAEPASTQTVTITLPASFAPVTPIGEQADEQTDEQSDDQLAGQTEHPMLAFVGLPVEVPPMIDLSVQVNGLANLTMSNDTQQYSGSGNFLLFSELPAPGANFYFSSPELENKTLSSLTLHPVWVPGAVANTSGLPDVVAIYANYVDNTNTPLVVNPDSYECELVNLGTDAAKLFNSNGIQFVQDMLIEAEMPIQMQFSAGSFYDELYVSSLNYQFQTTALANQQAVANAIINGEPVPDLEAPATVYPPYVPEISALTLDYTVEASGLQTLAFTGCEAFTTPSVEPDTQLAKQEALLLQIKQHTVEDSLSLLFMVVENNAIEFAFADEEQADKEQALDKRLPTHLQSGRTTGTLEDEPEHTVNWFILSSAQQWLPITPYRDQTQQLQSSGFVRFAWDDIREHISGAEHEIWLKLVPESSSEPDISITQAFPNILGIDCQGLELIEQVPYADPASAGQPLPARSIQTPPTIPTTLPTTTQTSTQTTTQTTTQATSTDTSESSIPIDSITQPQASVDGRPEETATQFSVRVSESLHHRNRAFSQKDYERLVLERFTGIQWVKCFSVNNASDLPQTSPIESGEIKLLIFPQAPLVETGQTPLLPIASHHTKQAVKQFIARRCPPRIPIEVESFPYTPVNIAIAVQFREGVDQNKATQEVKQAVVECVMPWAYQAQSPFIKGDNWQYTITLEISSELSQLPNVKLIEQVVVEPCNQEMDTSQGNIAILLPSRILINQEVE